MLLRVSTSPRCRNNICAKLPVLQHPLSRSYTNRLPSPLPGLLCTPLQKAGKLAFSPHYLMWSCPPEFLNTTECASECFHNGTYCVPEPDKDATKGPSGRDVLKVGIAP